MRKFVPAILALVMLVFLFGCTAEEENSEPSPAPETSLCSSLEERDISFEVRYAERGWPSSVGHRMMEVRFLEDGNIIGYALINPNFAREDYAGEIIAFQEYPKVDGEYQNITEEELTAAIAEAREEYRIKKVEERLKEEEEHGG